ncbi:aminoglycoside phosphotransferase family protein [Pseudohongiella sp.]|uniref:Aminoglycoside phosphotransferase domain-containing protein n=1 Tax=marine sediment metagenome TaxID=412755 RepID=A0A0F9VNZ3_9ZZZZ|nr:phosphotransferase [Pseudohongiella sp.]HDZ10017.1 phosphotransferase [Pseudohongiella sp.]HEA63913.1 phosphotransferase [Pseudohongiella sp.]
MNSAEARQQQLQDWAQGAIRRQFGVDPGVVKAEALGGDASFRRYFRFRPGLAHQSAALPASLMLVDAPPAQENNPAFVRAADEFAAAGLRTPDIHAHDLDQGFMVLEDFGDQLMLPCLQQAQTANDSDRVNVLYHHAMASLLSLQAHPAPSALPPYDQALLRRELSLFDEWFCERMLGMHLGADERVLLATTWQLLEASALAQPQARVHRDYHSRNLMLLPGDDGRLDENQAPGVIDFQDAVIGPVTYDLVSLLRDCYIVWPQSDVERWALAYHEQAQARGIVPATHSRSDFMRDFDLMGLQRHIKVLGIFCRLALRDNKQRYLLDLPVVMAYVSNVAARHPSMEPFLTWFRAGPMPKMQARLTELSS